MSSIVHFLQQIFISLAAFASVLNPSNIPISPTPMVTPEPTLKITYVDCYFNGTYTIMASAYLCIKDGGLLSSPTPTPSIYQKSVDWSVTKTDNLTTTSDMPPDSRMSTSQELFDALNEYRKAHNIGMLQSDDTLCSIANTRAGELQQLGKLDSHNGWYPLYNQFSNQFGWMGENIGGGTTPYLGVHIIEWGWGRSLTGHKETMLDTKYNRGCCAVAGLFAVCEFGQK